MSVNCIQLNLKGCKCICFKAGRKRKRKMGSAAFFFDEDNTTPFVVLGPRRDYEKAVINDASGARAWDSVLVGRDYKVVSICGPRFGMVESAAGVPLSELFEGYMLSVFENLVENAFTNKTGNVRLNTLFYGREPVTVQVYCLQEPVDKTVCGALILCQPVTSYDNTFRGGVTEV